MYEVDSTNMTQRLQHKNDLPSRRPVSLLGDALYEVILVENVNTGMLVIGHFFSSHTHLSLCTITINVYMDTEINTTVK